jgi:DNA polymerase III gamma/tau subunit
MSSLAIKYRPKTLDDFTGNRNVTESISGILSKDDIPQTFLISGPSGTGKTTLAYIIKNTLGVSDIDFYEHDASTDRGIDSIRAIRKTLPYAPNDGDYKIIFFDECHGITGEAGEALLKMTENPPGHVFFIFCTTDPQKLKPTLKRRCTKFDLISLTSREMNRIVRTVAKKEKIDLSSTVRSEIIKLAEGSPGAALSFLDSVVETIDDDEKCLSILKSLTYDEKSIVDIIKILLQPKTSAQKWHKIRPMLHDLTGDAEGCRRVFLAYMGKVMINKKNEIEAGFIRDMMEFFEEPFFYGGMPLVWSAVLDCCRLSDTLENDIPF